MVLHAQRDGCDIHHADPQVERIHITQRLEALSVGVDVRVFGVDGIDLGGLDKYFGIDFACAQRAGSIGGEIRVAGARAKDDDATFLHMPDSASADIRLGYGAHLNGSLYTYRNVDVV